MVKWKPMQLMGWGRVTRASVTACLPEDVGDAIEGIRAVSGEGIIPFGSGTSYGDAALNQGGRAVLTGHLSRIHAFDCSTGVLVCGAGVTFHDLVRLFLPCGFMAPVSPGTGLATIGGALATDAHGKNHDRFGSFGDHVLWMDLLLPSGHVERIAPESRPDLFAATVGGMGLTGVILNICFAMQRVPSNAVVLREERVPNLESFFVALERARYTATYSVGWVDALARGSALGRGILQTAEPAAADVRARPLQRPKVPIDFPACLLNRGIITTFNHWYYARVPRTGREQPVLLECFLYPLDAVLAWNRLYGKEGFYQFQCVLPDATSQRGIRRLLEEVSSSRAICCLAVLKTLGGEGRGYLSFPMRGHTLALDFPRRSGTDELLHRLERITLDHGGRIYLAKDAHLSAAMFEVMYPKLDVFRAVLDQVDPDVRMNSDLARRLGIRKRESIQVTPGKPVIGSAWGARLQSIVDRVKASNRVRTTVQDASVSESRSRNHKPELLTVQDAKTLSVSETARLFRKHMNPGQYQFLRLLGFEDVLIDTAEGMYYTDKRGRKILDFFGGFGSLALGHNHPRILEARRQFQAELRHEIAIAFMSQYATALARNLAAIAPGDLDMVFLGSTGSEAVEAALKLAELAQGPKRATIAFAENSFHGKTRGALSVTDSAYYQSTLRLLGNRVRIPFGDADALERALERDPSIGVLILETIQGGAGIVVAPQGYWQDVRRLCDRYSVLWIADEVQCGVGRTGRFFAFEHEDAVPDIVTLAKSLGGGKTAIGAMIARTPIYMKAYGTPGTALIHGPATFSGMGETCCTAIETLNVLYDEGLIDNAARQGEHLLGRLRLLQRKYSNLVKEVRGKGLMVGVEFCDVSRALPLGLRQIVSVLDEKLEGSLCGIVGSLLFEEYGILVAFTEYNRNVMRLEPPLIVTQEQIDTFVNTLEALLSRGLIPIVSAFLRNYLHR